MFNSEGGGWAYQALLVLSGDNPFLYEPCKCFQMKSVIFGSEPFQVSLFTAWHSTQPINLKL